MPKHELVDIVKNNPYFIFNNPEGYRVVETFEKSPSFSTALDEVLKCLKTYLLLLSKNAAFSTKSKIELELGKAWLEVFKTIYYGAEKNFSNFSEFPTLVNEKTKNIDLLESWSTENIENINKTLRS